MRQRKLIVLHILILLSLCILLPKQAAAQLVPNFSADITEGCAPVITQFRDLSTGNPTSWFWDLGNGITSTQQNPTTFYFEPGKYTVKLTVKSGNQTREVIKEQYITSHAAPNVGFKAENDTFGCFPYNVKFVDFSEPGSGTITSRQWDYGDGTISQSNVLDHVYNVAGSFTVSLKVTNSLGCTQIKSLPSYINVKGKLTAAFATSDTLFCNAPAWVQFRDASSGGDIVSRNWNFGDGSTSNAPSPNHMYASGGQYSVQLTVTNEFGCVSSITKPNLVNVRVIKAGFSAADTICQRTPTNFTNLSLPASQSLQWNFGDGTTSTALNPVKTYNNPGTYPVRLISSFLGCSDTIIKPILVNIGPNAAFKSTSPVNSCTLPFTVSFSPDAPAQAYLWEFGDGAVSTEAAPVHTYTREGRFNVTLTVTAENGCTNKLTRSNLVNIGPPTINRFNGLPLGGCTPASANISANISTPEPVATYLWNLGDGRTSQVAAPAVVYTDSGSRAVSLTITTVNGCRASYTLQNAVVLNSRPKTNFSVNPAAACAFQPVTYIDSTIGGATAWSWDFGDGGKSTLQNPTHAYEDTGYFSVSLIVFNNACSDTLFFPDYVYVSPPIARFSILSDCDEPGQRTFSDTSVSPQQWSWNFGDGNTSAEKNPIHNFPGTGTYRTTLEVSNGNCKHSFGQDIIIVDENPKLVISDTALCRNITTELIATNIDTSLIASYTWRFGDGRSAVTTTPRAQHIYSTAGDYLPGVVITDKNGCEDSVFVSVALKVYGPVADFTTTGGACLNGTVSLTDRSASYASYPITTWIWNYGDGTSDTLGSASSAHTYNRIGLFEVRLRVVDTRGCTDATTTPRRLLITKPFAFFSLADSLNCTDKQVNFTSQATGFGLAHNWNLGDGTTAQTRNVIHSYGREGQYNIRLVVTDTFGCRDTITSVNAVRVANVKAGMLISDTSSSCPPFLVSLVNTSRNYSSISWNFDDGSFSNLDSPLHFYITPGVYRLKLVANGYGSCKDSAVQVLRLRGPSGRIKYSPFDICSGGAATFTAETVNKASFIWDYGDGNTRISVDTFIRHTYINPGKYVPKLILADEAGCQVPILGRDTITVIKPEARINQVEDLYCDSTTIQFTDSSSALFDVITRRIWNFGDGRQDFTNINPANTFTSHGRYNVSLRVVTAKGCSDTAFLPTTIQIVQSPRINITADTGICVFDAIAFTGNLLMPDTSIINWQWTFGDGHTAQTQVPAPFVYQNAGSYNVAASATNSSGCTGTFNFPVQVHPLPLVDAGIDTAVCVGQRVTLRPSGAESYLWKPHPTLNCTSCAEPVVAPSTTNAYFVTGTSRFGCKKQDSIHVRILRPFTLSTSSNDTLCVGQAVNLLAMGTYQYQWFPTAGLSNPLISNPVANPVTTTNYQVIASDSLKCFIDTAYVKITVFPMPVFNILEENINLAVGGSVQLRSTSSPDISQWRWIPTNGLSCANCPEPTSTPRNTITYTAQARNNGGCLTEDQVTITVICNNGNVFIPNTFSPNNDGMNDLFYPRGKGVASVKSMTIFNRWGAVVFQKTNFSINDPQAGWNGTVNGTTISPDVYVYKIDVVCENSEIISLKGNITVLK